MVKLYHSTPYPTDSFRVINPGTRNVAIRTTPEGSIAEAIPYDESNAPYVYAADNEQLSITYAISKGLRLGNFSLPGGEVLYIEKESIIGEPELKGGVFSFESDRFMQLEIDGQKSAQWVSPDSVDLLKADFLPVRSLNDIMKSGVQVYQIADNTEYTSYQYYLDLCDATDDASVKALIHDRVQSGALRWLNEERGINPANLLVNDAPATGEQSDVKAGASSKPLVLG